MGSNPNFTGQEPQPPESPRPPPQQWTTITRASLHPMLVKGQPEGVAHDMFNRVIGAASADMAAKSTMPRALVAHRLIAAFSATLYCGISPQAYTGGTQIDYADAASRAQLVDALVDGLLCPKQS